MHPLTRHPLEDLDPTALLELPMRHYFHGPEQKTLADSWAASTKIQRIIKMISPRSKRRHNQFESTASHMSGFVSWMRRTGRGGWNEISVMRWYLSKDFIRRQIALPELAASTLEYPVQIKRTWGWTSKWTEPMGTCSYLIEQEIFVHFFAGFRNIESRGRIQRRHRAFMRMNREILHFILLTRRTSWRLFPRMRDDAPQTNGSWMDVGCQLPPAVHSKTCPPGAQNWFYGPLLSKLLLRLLCVVGPSRPAELQFRKYLSVCQWAHCSMWACQWI